MANIKIRVEGLEQLQEKLSIPVEKIVDTAARAAAERIKDAVVDQDWYDGSWTHPVKSGNLRRSGIADGNTVVWDADYARFIEARGGFFKPKVEEVGPEIFRDEIERGLREALGE